MTVSESKLNLKFGPKRKTPLKNALVAGLALLSLLYIINPTAGLWEILPDNLPLIGNLDELTASLILFNAFQYFGFDVFSLLFTDHSQIQTKTNNTEN